MQFFLRFGEAGADVGGELARRPWVSRLSLIFDESETGINMGVVGPEPVPEGAAQKAGRPF